MANKHGAELRVYVRIKELIEKGLCNKQVLERIRTEFRDHRTGPEQVRYWRSVMRHSSRFKDIPTSVEARHRKAT